MKVSVLMGGTSSEREVSLKTGKAVINACLELGYETNSVDFNGQYDSILNDLKYSDIVFNALHGTVGEDGIIQSWLDENNINYTGSDSNSSRLCMNKNETKKIVQKNNYLTPSWFTIDKDLKITDEIIKTVKFPCIVKPNAQGSTFGLSMVNNKKGLTQAIELSGKYDNTSLIEEYIIGREITVGILDNKALPIIEIIPDHKLYDYECKYSPGMSQYLCPADIDFNKEKQIKEDSEKIFKLLGCSGYGRLDFLLDRDDRHFFLEINTLPGMTSTSLLPIAADKSGKSFTELIDIILEISAL
tara:strand:- start:227 stop:1129 length:903 start_codon:yes stop_codon:yes gene_type:complete